jgi:phosphomannomutase
MDVRANPVHFGTDGWRGVIADDYTFTNLRRVTAATASYVNSRTRVGDGSVLIAYDRRFMSRAFAEEVARVLCSQKISVQLSVQPMPTPAVSFSVVHRKASWGIMITASHNPALYNGFKIKDSIGRSAPLEVTREIEAFLALSSPNTSAGDPSSTLDFPPTCSENDGLKMFDDLAAYERYLKGRLDWKLFRNHKARVVFDHMYGVGADIPERVLTSAKMTLFSLHTKADPLFGGLHPEPIESQLTELMKEVRTRKAVVGIALDGDADRLGIVDEKGQYLTPHQVFPMLVLHCIEHKRWKGKIVQAVSLGYLSERIAHEFNLPFEEVPVGFKHVAERMLQSDFLAGGEESGGYAVRGGLPERDGILNGLLFLEMLAARRQTPSQLLKALEKRFGAARFKRIDIHLEQPILDRNRFAQDVSARVPDRLAGERVTEVRTRDGVKMILKSGSWVLLRPSGTEPLIRTYAESESLEKTNTLLRWAGKLALTPAFATMESRG